MHKASMSSKRSTMASTRSVTGMHHEPRQSVAPAPCAPEDEECAKGRKSMAPGSAPRRRTKFHIRLKRVGHDFKDDSIEYVVERPFRACIRMEYLMQSHKARLNDKEFMDTLYTKISAEENKTIENVLRQREKGEVERTRKLVIAGKMKPPHDMLYLKHHPIFRVNDMLKRLDEQKDAFTHEAKIKGSITPMEPYEYNGDMFFQHLHKHGTYWMPPEELDDHDEKMAGKIARAKLRLREKRRKRKENDEMMRVMYNTPSDPTLSKEEKKKIKDAMVAKVQRRFDKLGAKLAKEKVQLEQQEKFRKANAEKRKNDLDWIFLQKDEKSRLHFVESYRSRESSKTSFVKRAKSQSIYSFTKSKKKPKIPYNKLFEKPKTPPQLQESESFIEIRRGFNIAGSKIFDGFRPPENPLIAKYVDEPNNPLTIMNNGTEISHVLAREQERADDFLIELGRVLYAGYRK